MDSIQTFTRFLRLPPEIRVQIWHFSLSPRAVPISHGCRRTPAHRLAARAMEKIPTILRVCKESRALGLGLYQRFSSKHFQGGYANLALDMIWHVNCQHEALECILAFHPTRVWQAGLSNLARLASDRENIKGITALALCACELELTDDDPGSGPEFEEFLESLRAYTNLKDLYFVEGGTRRYVRCPELNWKRREPTRAPVGEQRTTLVEQITRLRKSLEKEAAKRYRSWIPPRIHYGQTHEKWEGPERLCFHPLDMDENNLGKVDIDSK